MSQPLFFSIVVPAHNEEKYITKTLKSIADSVYPLDRVEVIVVENGSTDATAQVAKESSALLPLLRVISNSEAGISKARNRGIREIHTDSDWVIFLDADTYMAPAFLVSLNTYLQKPSNQKKVIGTATLTPWPRTLFMCVLYVFSNALCFLFRSTYGGACFVRRDILTREVFDEHMEVGEDAEFANRVKKHGKYFFFYTRDVYTSTRRFTHDGWKLIPIYLGMGLVAEFAPHWKNNFVYKVIR